jgi:hypothetical protein
MGRSLNQRSDRLRLLLALLQWEGEIRSSRIQQLLSVTAVPASRLITQFREVYPGLIENDTRRKRWVLSRAASARAQLATNAPRVDEYLALTAEDDTNDCVVEARQTFLDPAPSVFSTLRRACLAKTGVTITYASMNHPEGVVRTIYPHALVRGNQRWHARAWCEERQEYRDFAVGRMSSPSLVDAPRKQLPPDHAWETMIEVRVGAHSALPMDKEKVIRDEYFHGKVGRRFTVRAALVNYLLNDIRAAIDPRRQVPPEYLLEVSNLEEVRPHLFSAQRGVKRS